jgi:hypothetical protein
MQYLKETVCFHKCSTWRSIVQTLWSGPGYAAIKTWWTYLTEFSKYDCLCDGRLVKLAERAYYLSMLTEAMVWHYMVFDRLSWNNSWVVPAGQQAVYSALLRGRTSNPRDHMANASACLVAHPNQAILISAHPCFPQNSPAFKSYKWNRSVMFLLLLLTPCHSLFKLTDKERGGLLPQHIFPHTILFYIFTNKTGREKQHNKEKMGSA